MSLTFRPFRQQKHRNDVIVTSYIKILKLLNLKSKDNTKQTLQEKFYASRVKKSKLEGSKIRPQPRFWSVFKSPVKIGISTCLIFQDYMRSSTSCIQILISVTTIVVYLCNIYLWLGFGHERSIDKRKNNQSVLKLSMWPKFPQIDCNKKTWEIWLYFYHFD